MSVNEQAKERGALSLSLHQSHTSDFKWRIFYKAELTLRFGIGCSMRSLTIKERRGIFHALSSPNLAPGFFDESRALPFCSLSRYGVRRRTQFSGCRLSLPTAFSFDAAHRRARGR